MEKAPACNQFSLVAVQDDGLTPAVRSAPPRIRANGAGFSAVAPVLSELQVWPGLQLQVRFFPAYGLGSLAGRMFWLMWKMLSGS